MNGTDFSKLGSTMAGLRIKNNLTQQQLAERVGTTRQTIARIEKGHGAKVAIGTWAAITDALSYHLDIERDFITVRNAREDELSLDISHLYEGYEHWWEV